LLEAHGAPPALSASGSPSAGSHGPFRRGLRVLLAEDNTVNQKLATRLLEKQGHTIQLAVNGREALNALAVGDFDVVLMDAQMPEMDGFEATAHLRGKEAGTGRRLPIIAMTAHAMKGDRERCLEAGMDGYVSKPIRMDELNRAIEAVVLAASAAKEPRTK
jgi:two-component system, sensor histidine kinase and response regulator